MNLVFIYGPPAVGKYTVGKELAKLTGYKLLHNHVTVDMVASVFDVERDRFFFGLVRKYREDMVREAVKHDINLIMTYVYDPGDEKNVRKFVDLVKNHGGKAMFVRLYTNTKVLHERRKSESRKKFLKIKDRKTMDNLLKKYELFKDVQYKENIAIDNTKLGPKAVARMIVRHYHLVRL